MKWFIREYYHYPGQVQRRRFYKLVWADGIMFEFECGHRVTDNVFGDMVRLKTGIQVFEDTQTEIEF